MMDNTKLLPKSKRLKMHLRMLCLCVSTGPFVLSVASLYAFLLFIMFHPVETIDNFLDVRTQNKRNALVHQFPSYLLLITDAISPSLSL